MLSKLIVKQAIVMGAIFGQVPLFYSFQKFERRRNYERGFPCGPRSGNHDCKKMRNFLRSNRRVLENNNQIIGWDKVKNLI